MIMNRRELLSLGVMGSAVLMSTEGLFAMRLMLNAEAPGKTARTGAAADPVHSAKEAHALAAKDILKEGQPAPIANYCEHPEKQPNKFCPDWKSKPGNCTTCAFYNLDKSETTVKGVKYARCQLLPDPKKPQFVSEKAYCASYVKKP